MNSNFDNFAVAVSGGADSMALLHMMARHAPTVLHVNHGLRAAADAEEQYVIDTCKKLDIPCVTFRVGSLPTANLESAARDARYRLMIDWCRASGVGTLMTAHQADDQIETFWMNLGRGSGLRGLAAMQSETMRDGVRIVRPLLDKSRADLEKYCNDNGIRFFNDEMNDDEKYTRVKIRKNRHALGISDDRILLAIKNLARARDALESIVNCGVPIINSDRVVFPASQLFSLPDELQLRWLGDTLRRVGGGNYSPRLTSTERLRDKLKTDTVSTLSHCTIRRLGDKILIVREGESTSFKERRNEKAKDKK